MLKKWLRSPLVTGALFVVALGLILFGGIRAIQAAPRILSNWFGAQVELDDIDVAIVEQAGDNASLVHGDDALFTGLLGEGEDAITPGIAYPEKLAVRNTLNDKNNAGGDDGVRIIQEYVRVTVYKYWTRTDPETGEVTKATDLDPSLIDLKFVTDNGWSIDADSTTDERTVLYYASIVPPQGDTTNFIESIRIDSKVMENKKVTKQYKGATFKVEVVADAVQTHNGKDAMKGAWGKNDMITVGADAEK